MLANGSTYAPGMIVSSHFNEDVSWLEKFGYPYWVVSKSKVHPRVNNFNTIPNQGLEFSSYLWFLLNNWDNLPDSIAFIHGHKDSYHQQESMDFVLKNLIKSDFCYLNGDFSVAIHCLNAKHPWFNQYFSEMWSYLGLDSVCSAPNFAIVKPSTQCLISRDFLKSRGRQFWERIFSCLMSHQSHYQLALVLEIAWPFIFDTHPDHQQFQKFKSFFDREDLSILIAHPKEAWNSSMKIKVMFDVPESRSMWVSHCIEIFSKFY
jgi:hypothetical protein